MKLQAHEQTILLLFFIFLHFQIPVTAEEPTFTFCGSSNYTSGSQFETNLETVLPSLSNNVAQSHDSFYNTTYGDEPNRVYGFSQCMSAASEDACRQCLINSTTEIVQRCPNSAEATIRYYNCILRYSNRSFLSEPDTTIRTMLVPSNSVTNTSLFNRQLGGLMDYLSLAAKSATSKYAVNMTNYDDFDKIYGMAQCTRDLSESNCYSCLRNMISGIRNCCDGRTGGNVYSVSCNIRYDMYLFYDMSQSPPPPVAASPPPALESPDTKPTAGSGNSGKSKSRTIAIVVSTVVLLIVISTICTWLLLRRRKTDRRIKTEIKEESGITVPESFSFNLGTLKAATNNFSTDNKLGEGGFGPVYKGKLSDGRDIAVKRLSTRSGQGIKEMINEVALVAKLQHRNLVRLWGWCIEEQEKMLVYEYVANTSLDKFLFDPVKRFQLNWETRYKIIAGIARGLLYLHEDSRLRIIHRDLKASNILLDGNMNPKIADFGLAKLFSVDQTQGNTSRIAGTYGYMAPEYIIHGQFSTQSDVFSFGVLVLEIVIGQKNLPFSEDEHMTNLVSYVWQHWQEGTSLEIIDRSIEGHHSTNEILRCLHMGLLCVQDDATKRPTMSSIVLMLNSYSMTLPVPSPPAFFIGESSTSNGSVVPLDDKSFS